MTRILVSFMFFVLGATVAQAACYADYKAKKDNPLQLLYGVAEVYGACTTDQAYAELTPRLAADGWQLLEIVGTFDESGLEGRRESAGEYYLRY